MQHGTAVKQHAARYNGEVSTNITVTIYILTINSQIPSRFVCIRTALYCWYDSAIGTKVGLRDIRGIVLWFPAERTDGHWDRPTQLILWWTAERTDGHWDRPTQLILWWTAGVLPGLKRRWHAIYHSAPVRPHVTCVELYLKSPIRLPDAHGNSCTGTKFRYLPHAFFWLPTSTFIVLGSSSFFRAATL